MLGYVERRADPTYGRAKLVSLTDRGWTAVRSGRAVIAQIETDWAARIGEERFGSLLGTMQDLLDALDPSISDRYETPPERGV